jgi:hypothetical protein
VRRLRRGDEGSAIVEFFFLGVLVLVPLTYVMLTVFEVQRSAFAVSAASREAGRAYATADTLEEAQARAGEAARIALADHGIAFRPEMLTFPDGTSFAPGARVVVVVRHRAPLPLLSRLFADDDQPGIDVSGRHVATVDVFRAG